MIDTRDLTAQQLLELPLREVMRTVTQRLATLEWLHLHPGAREMAGAPGWYIHLERPEETAGPFYRMTCYRAADGATAEARKDLYWDFMNPAGREGRTFDRVAADELRRQGLLE